MFFSVLFLEDNSYLAKYAIQQHENWRRYTDLTSTQSDYTLKKICSTLHVFFSMWYSFALYKVDKLLIGGLYTKVVFNHGSTVITYCR